MRHSTPACGRALLGADDAARAFALNCVSRTTESPGAAGGINQYLAIVLSISGDDADRPAVVAYQDFIRITEWTGNTALMVEHEFFGINRTCAEFCNREGREIRGLTVEEQISRLGQDLIPLG
jgi:hypothetical protein